MFSKLLNCTFILLLTRCFHLMDCSGDDYPKVYIDNDEFKGSIRGKTIRDSNVQFMGFRGIPYAKPPVKDLRFRDPQKLDKFEGSMDAAHDGRECYSLTARNGSEDCLYLNVYTKNLNASRPLPVVVLIHPGGLYLGSGISCVMRPGHMMTQDWVLVTFNYRLGALGFLNLGTAEIPGNAGFKDQVFALRWIQKYIKYFGGEPKDVTLMGYSAGALSIQLHLISPMSKDLFKQGILMSGSLPPQTYLPEQQKYLAVRLAKRLNCEKFRSIEEEIPYGVDNKFWDYETIKIEDILECLNQHNGSEIAGKLRPMFDFFKDNPMYLWLPVIEKDFHQERFLSENFTVQRKNVLIGYTNGELCLSAKEILESDDAKMKFSKEFDNLAPRAFMYERHPQRDIITEKIKQKYFNGSTDFSFTDYDSMCDVFSDAIMRFGAHELAEFLVRNQGRVYFYEFSYVEDPEKQEEIDRLKNSTKRCEHMNDFQYLFNWPGRKHDSQMLQKIIKMYTGFMYDFVTNGQLSNDQAKQYPHSYAAINESIEYKQGLSFKNYEFWHNMFPKYFNYNLI